jgi:hypothetical protein
MCSSTYALHSTHSITHAVQTMCGGSPSSHLNHQLSPHPQSSELLAPVHPASTNQIRFGSTGVGRRLGRSLGDGSGRSAGVAAGGVGSLGPGIAPRGREALAEGDSGLGQACHEGILLACCLGNGDGACGRCKRGWGSLQGSSNAGYSRRANQAVWQCTANTAAKQHSRYSHGAADAISC